MRGLTRFLVWLTIIVGGIIGIARATAIRWTRLPTDDVYFTTSLKPSLNEGDLVLLWRLGEPTFGDLVLCPEPDYPERVVIGRIVGLPGDTVEFTDGKLFLNGETFPWERNCDPKFHEYPHPEEDSEVVKQACEMEDLSGRLHRTGIINGQQVPPPNGSFEVEAGSYFLVSDNRLFPYDSREYGPVPIESCKESVIGRLVSKNGWTDSEQRLKYIR